MRFYVKLQKYGSNELSRNWLVMQRRWYWFDKVVKVFPSRIYKPLCSPVIERYMWEKWAEAEEFARMLCKKKRNRPMTKPIIADNSSATSEPSRHSTAELIARLRSVIKTCKEQNIQWDRLCKSGNNGDPLGLALQGNELYLAELMQEGGEALLDRLAEQEAEIVRLRGVIDNLDRHPYWTGSAQHEHAVTFQKRYNSMLNEVAKGATRCLSGVLTLKRPHLMERILWFTASLTIGWLLL